MARSEGRDAIMPHPGKGGSGAMFFGHYATGKSRGASRFIKFDKNGKPHEDSHFVFYDRCALSSRKVVA